MSELNRALLARQGLLERSRRPVVEMVERVVGLQAQEPADPYVGLWTRLARFDPQELSGAIERRELVRANVMRNTIHLVSARDCLAIQPLTQPVLHGTFRSQFAKHLAPDPAEVAAAAAPLFAAEPQLRVDIGRQLADRWPDEDPALLGQAAAHHLALVHATPRGLWRRSGRPRLTLTSAWLDGVPAPEPSIDELVLRYLRAFGPAAPADVRTWCRITGLREVIDRLRPGLRVFRDEHGRELLDVQDGELPDPGIPAPPRFLPQYDNVVLSHDDRTRVLAGIGPGPPAPRGSWTGSLLADGFHRAFWSAAITDDDATLTVDRFAPLAGDPPQTREAIEAEGLGLLELLAPGRAPRVVFSG